MDRILDQRYRILEPIGAGGSSQVYLAQDTALGREVAIKVLDPQAAADGTLRKLFVKEARALAQLTHPNIVGVYDVGEVDGLPFIVMEHVAGSSLKQRIERSGALPLDDAVRLTDEIANGLAFAHSRGIIHADMKPSNILLDQSDQPKICDFGIARTPAEESDSPQLFATALYVAPERVEGRPASVASDIYGLGLVVYEMLVGKPPFTSGNAAVLLRDHVVRPPVPPSHLRPSLPKEVDSIVLKALAKDPALRYHKATDIGEALSKMLQTHNAATAAATHSFDDYAPTVMTEPLRGFVPRIEQSPVVALLTAYGQPIRRAFYGLLAALPLFALTVLAGFGLIPAAFMAAIILVTGFAGQLGLALSIGWVIETVLLFLFVPGLALIWAFMGIFVWLRDVSAERTAMAIAMPATAPFGLAPALVLSASAIHGLGGVVTVLWGAAMTIVFAIASGRQSLGAFVQSGLSLQQESLFSASRAADVKGALLNALQGSDPDRFNALFGLLDPTTLWGQMTGIVSRISTADVTWIATIMAWVVTSLVVWTVTRLLRSTFDSVLRRPKRWFALYVFAATAGIAAGAAILYMVFVTWAQLANSPGRPAGGVLLVAAFVGATLAVAVSVVISATERPEPSEEPTPTMAGRHVPVR
ncbi:MAG TPA: serine/threonine-protein kinase [Patescibacteria group bacterium]|nr:serine/threonine-protein kinase [Patescibacteria group bacterium]